MKGQSEDDISRVDDLLQKYIERERTVVLAVVPASQDIATVEVLEVCFTCLPALLYI